MRRSSPHFTLFGLRAATGQATEYPRFGITASRKLGNAVFRNRLRRRTREALRGLRSPACPCRIVVNPRPAAANADFALVSAELQQQVEKLCRALSGTPELA